MDENLPNASLRPHDFVDKLWLQKLQVSVGPAASRQGASFASTMLVAQLPVRCGSHAVNRLPAPSNLLCSASGFDLIPYAE